VLTVLALNCVVRAAAVTCSATWNFYTDLPFGRKPRKTTHSVDRVDRSLDLPDAN